MHSTLSAIMVLALLLPALSGCSPRRMAVREMAAVLDTGAAAFENDGDLDMLAQALPANIKLAEAMLASDPDNALLKTTLSRLYASYAFAFLEPLLEMDHFGLEIPALRRGAAAAWDPARVRRQALACYEKGAGYAMEAMARRHPAAPAQLIARDDRKALLATMTEADVPALFWWAFNLGAQIHLDRRDVGLLAKAPAVEEAMHASTALDPAYQNGGAHLFLMAYYGSRPPMMGGSPAAAGKHYEALMRIAGEEFLLGQVYYGRYILQPAQDRPAFTALMDAVAGAPAGGRYRLYNAVAADRARIYRQAVDALFTEEEPP